MTLTAKRLASIDDFLALEGGARAELIDGQIIEKARPSGEHGDIATSTATTISKFFKRKSQEDGTGGLWIISEVSIRYRFLGDDPD